MTAIIFYSGFIGVYGFIIGKSFKRLNPFLMLLGMFFSIPVIAQVEQNNQPLLYIPFAIGFFANFGNPLRKVTDFFSEIKMNIDLSQANKRYKKEQKRREREQAKEQARREKQAKQNKRRSTNHNNQSQQNTHYSEQQRQAQAEQERLRRQAEELRRQREQFQREQAQARNNQSSSNDDLDPNNFNDACEILGCKPTDNLATFKKAYRYLRAMYHPDKMEQFGGRRKKQAEVEMKLINLAWARVQKKFK